MTAHLLVERQEKPSERVLSPRAIEVDLLRAVRTNRLKERLIARQWFQTGPSIPAIPVSSNSPPGTSGIHDQWHLASVFSHRHLFSHRPLSIVNHLIMVQPTPPKTIHPLHSLSDRSHPSIFFTSRSQAFTPGLIDKIEERPEGTVHSYYQVGQTGFSFTTR